MVEKREELVALADRLHAASCAILRGEDAVEHVPAICDAERELRSRTPSAPDVAMREALEPCRVEHKAFDKWAEANRYDMHQHSLHYLFVDPETYAARQGWKAALEYVSSALSASEAKAGGPS